MPDRTAFEPAVRSTVIVAVPPGHGDREAHPGAFAEFAQRRALTIDCDDLPAPAVIEVHRIEMHDAAVGPREVQVHLDLIRVVVGRGVACQLAGF